jgi:hypothetical protein
MASAGEASTTLILIVISATCDQSWLSQTSCGRALAGGPQTLPRRAGPLAPTGHPLAAESHYKSQDRLQGRLSPANTVTTVDWDIPNSYLIRYIINTHLNRHRLGVD